MPGTGPQPSDAGPPDDEAGAQPSDDEAGAQPSDDEAGAQPSDAGSSDAGPSDAGPSDAGPSDAGPPDDEAGARLRTVLVPVAVFVLAGVLAGLMWPHLVPHPRMVMTPQGPFPLTESDAGRLIAIDGWYAVLAAGLGALCGTGLFILFRRRGAWTVAGLAAGSVLAAGVALVLGTYIGSGDVILAWAPSVVAGTPLRAPVSVRAYGVLAVWPLAALLPVVVLGWLLPWRADAPPRLIHSPGADGHRAGRPGR